MNPHINIASDIGSLAADLDYYKNGLPPPLRAAAEGLVREMHGFAQALLGDEEGAVYAPDDGQAHEVRP